MDKQRKSRAPLIVAILLLLPMFYVGSYLAMVLPEGQDGRIEYSYGRPNIHIDYYRFGSDRALLFFWPLERIDRKVRPEAWEVEHWREP
jgi:hypothetical protein